VTPCYGAHEGLLVWRDEHGDQWIGVPDALGRVLAGPLGGYPESDPRSGFKAFGGLRRWVVRNVELVFPKPGDREALKRWPVDPADVKFDEATEIRNVFVVRPAWVALLGHRLFAAALDPERCAERLQDFERNQELRRALDAAERLGGLDGLRALCATIPLPLW
jgi:hypothetical protein